MVNRLEEVNGRLEREKMELVEEKDESRRRYEELKLSMEISNMNKVSENVNNLVVVPTPP